MAPAHEAEVGKLLLQGPSHLRHRSAAQPAAFRWEAIVHELLYLKVPSHGPLSRALLKVHLAGHRAEIGGLLMSGGERKGGRRSRRILEAPMPTREELEAARDVYLEGEDPRDLSYRAPMTVMGLAWHGSEGWTLPDAVGVLLRDWNRDYFRYRGGFTEGFMLQLDVLIAEHRTALERLRDRTIASFSEDDQLAVEDLFGAFEDVAGKVGASKGLHLLASRFFPIWDNAIIRGYWRCLSRRETSAEAYCSFMEISKRQSECVGEEAGLGWNPLKALDEYNIVKFTRPRRKKRRLATLY